MRTCKYCQAALDADARFCGLCGQATSVDTDEYTRHSDAAYPGVHGSDQNMTFISPSNPSQARSQQFPAEQSSNDAPYWSNAPDGNPASQENTALVSRPSFVVQDSGHPANTHAPTEQGTPPSPADYLPPQAHTPHTHQYPQQAVRLNQTVTPINHLAPTTHSPAARRAGSSKGYRSPGRTLAVSALLLAIAIVVPLLYMAITHASPSLPAPAPVGLMNCPTMPTMPTLNMGTVVEGQSQPVSMPFTLCTQGTGTVTWTSEWNQQQAPWLQIDHSGQIPAPQSSQITVSATAKDLTAGTHYTTVTFSDGTNKVPVSVILTVKPSPTPTPIPTPMPSPTPSPIPSPSPTPMPSPSPTPMPSPTPSPTPLPTPSPSPSPSPTPSATSIPPVSLTPTP